MTKNQLFTLLFVTYGVVVLAYSFYWGKHNSAALEAEHRQQQINSFIEMHCGTAGGTVSGNVVTCNRRVIELKVQGND